MSPARLRVTVSPGAKRSSLAQLADGSVQVRVAAPPTEGKANRELLRFLAGILDVPGSRLSLAQGAASRHKVVEVDDLDLDEVMRRVHSAAAPE